MLRQAFAINPVCFSCTPEFLSDVFQPSLPSTVFGRPNRPALIALIGLIALIALIGSIALTGLIVLTRVNRKMLLNRVNRKMLLNRVNRKMLQVGVCSPVSFLLNETDGAAHELGA